MRMRADNLVGLMCHGVSYMGVISHCQLKLVSKGSVYLNITIIGRLITIWGKIFCKLRVSFNGLAIRKNVFLDSSQRIETHLDMVVEVLNVQISVSFDFCFDAEFI